MDWETINITRHLIIKWLTKNPTIREYKLIKKLIRTYGKLTGLKVNKILNNNKTYDEVAFYRIIKFLSIDDNEISTISNCLHIKNQMAKNQMVIKQEETW